MKSILEIENLENPEISIFPAVQLQNYMAEIESEYVKTSDKHYIKLVNKTLLDFIISSRAFCILPHNFG